VGVNLTKLSERPLEQEDINNVLNVFLNKLLSLCRPKKVIVFGSAAQGSMRPSSDLDVCIIFHSPQEVETYRKVILCSPPLVPGYPIDYLFYDEKLYQEKLNRGGVCELIEKEGIKIYDDLSVGT
jgi:predicted nucleotidyltransferase